MSACKLPCRKTSFSDWYNELVFQSELAENAPVRGCIVIRPYGCVLWEHMQCELDKRMKAISVQNAAFPLLIPERFIKSEADHIEGFAPELAVVTHAGGKKLEENLVVRPTSETIIHYMFARWINSWRDLPLKINQWCSVIRWEKRARPFIRTTEFWWQECHTAHETAQDADDQAQEALRLYENYFIEVLAIPAITAPKPQHERFAGALKTLTLEGMMGDGKALQMGTSHVLADTFAKAFDISFQGRDSVASRPHLTSWGITTRMIGAIIMVHGDQKGLVMPPFVAPLQIVIVPIFTVDNDQNETTKELCVAIYSHLVNAGFRVKIDDDTEKKPGSKYYHWELKGVPMRIEIGPKDIAKNEASLVMRDTGIRNAISLDILKNIESLKPLISEMLRDMHKRLYEKAYKNLHENIHDAVKLSEFGPQLSEKNGFYRTGWCGDTSSVENFKSFQATVRCILPSKLHEMCCIHDHCISKHDIIVAKAY